MSDIFDLAYSAAQKAMGAELWMRVSDGVRVHAIYEQIRGMSMEQVRNRPLFEEYPPAGCGNHGTRHLSERAHGSSSTT
jgi:hypothetical protein